MLSNFIKSIIIGLIFIVLAKIFYELWNLLHYIFFIKSSDNAFPKSFEQQLLGRNNEELIVA